MTPRATTTPEFTDPPVGGRVFEELVRPGLGDCAPGGRVRLDALARWQQDVAYADVEDAGVAEGAVWVIRRAAMQVARFPRFGGRYRLRTFCSGLGRMWAERRTQVIDLADEQVDVEVVAVWVHLDPATGQPSPLKEHEIETYGGGPASARRVSARLRHPGPPGSHGDPVDATGPSSHTDASGRAWRFRAAETDLAEHINNAAYWQPVEEELLAGEDPVTLAAEIEFRQPAQPGEVRILRDGDRWWLLGPAQQLHASLLVETDAP